MESNQFSPKPEISGQDTGKFHLKSNDDNIELLHVPKDRVTETITSLNAAHKLMGALLNQLEREIL